jgi:DNA-binding SARP family transcriptional activator
MVVSFLAHHPWEIAQAIVGEAVGPGLIPVAPGTPGVQRLSIETFLAQLEAEIRFQRDTLERDGLQSWRERAGGTDPLPALLALVRSEGLGPAQLERLGRAIDDARGLAIAVVAVGTLGATPWGDPVEVGADGGVDVITAAVLNGARTLYTLTTGEAAELLTVIACGRGSDIVPEIGGDEDRGPSLVQDQPSAEPQAAPGQPSPATPTAPASPLLTLPRALEPQRVDVRLYWRVRVLVDGREALRAFPAAGRQVLALLAIRGGLTEEQGIAALGADSAERVFKSRWEEGTRKTRSVLRELVKNRELDPIPSAGGVFRLNPEITGSDYGRLVAGRDAARQVPDADQRLVLLSRATDGVRGEPFAGADYAWLVEHQEQVRGLAIDVLSDLAQLQAEAGNLDAAIKTLDQALSIDPDPVERIFQRQTVLQHRMGRREAARELEERCDRAPSEETEALIESLGSVSHVVGR